MNDLEWATFSWTVITALGAGLAAFATGIWAVFTWMARRAADRAAAGRDLLRNLERKERLVLFAGERLKAGAGDGDDRREGG